MNPLSSARNANQVMLTQIDQIDTSNNAVLDPELKNELMKELSPEDLSHIKKGFDLFKGRVTIKQFICTMVDALCRKKNNMSYYAREILTFIELFVLIDLKKYILNHVFFSTGFIKFEEFTNYLIDRQKSMGQEQKRHFQPNEHLNRLEISAQKVFPLKHSKMIGILENNKKTIQLLEKSTYKPIENISFGGVIINCIIYLSDFNAYCITTNDKFMNFYDSTENELIRRFILPDPIFYMSTYKEATLTPRLIVGSTNGHLYEFNLKKILAIMNKKDKQVLKQEQKRKQQYSSHELYKAFIFNNNKVVGIQPDLTCIDILNALELFVTGSNDSKVRLYDMRENGLQLVKQLDGHYKGIKGVAVSQTHKVIISCSFDFDLLVWNAYLQHPVARLEGHEAPLSNVCCPQKHQIFISLDCKSIMKIWNAENYQLIQNLLIYENFPPNTSINFLYKNESDIAIVYTKKLRFFEFTVNYNPRVTDDYENFPVRYSPKNLQIYIGSNKSIKVWSIQRGIQIRHYKNIIESEISMIELDSRERRLFIGSIEGDVTAVDIFSGLVIGQYSSHTTEISLLTYSEENQLLITGGWEKKIKIHNDTQHLQRIENRENVLRNINNVSEKDLAGGTYSEVEMLIATYAKSNYCRIWDFEKGFLEAQIVVGQQIVLGTFLSPLPLLVLADSKGSIYIFSTKYYLKSPFTLLTQWKNMYSIQKTSQITYMQYQKVKGQNWLVLGDQYGYIRIVDMTQFIEQNDIRPITRDMLGNKNPYRIEDYNYLGTSQLSVNIHDFSGSEYETKVIVPPESIKQLLQIKAHQERINYISLIHESQEPMILSVGGDKLIKMWNYEGNQKGVLKQGLKENHTWGYKLGEKWQNKEKVLYKEIKEGLDEAFDEYLMKKRLSVIPFTEEEHFEEVGNEEIFRDLKEVDGYLEKTESYGVGGAKKKSRLY